MINNEPLYRIYSGNFATAVYFFSKKNNELFVYYQTDNDEDDDDNDDPEEFIKGEKVGEDMFRIDFFKNHNKIITKIECARYHTLFLCKDGAVFTRKEVDDGGQMGLPEEIILTRVNFGVPQKINVPSSSKVVDVKTGQESSFFITKKRACLACGNNYHGSFGIGGTNGNVRTPMKIFRSDSFNIDHTNVPCDIDTEWRFNQIIPGWEFCLYEMTNGDLYGAGEAMIRSSIPVKITFFEKMGIELSQINVCCSTALFLTTKGRVLAKHWSSLGSWFDKSDISNVWDLSDLGNIPMEARDKSKYLFTPKVLTQLTGIKRIHCGGYHVYFQNRKGQILACGDNGFGELGKNDNHTTHWMEYKPPIVQINVGFAAGLFVEKDGRKVHYLGSLSESTSEYLKQEALDDQIVIRKDVNGRDVFSRGVMEIPDGGLEKCFNVTVHEAKKQRLMFLRSKIPIEQCIVNK